VFILATTKPEDSTVKVTYPVSVSKEECFVLEEEIIDVSYFCNNNQAVAIKPVKVK